MILVTGGTGFIGSNIVSALARRGDCVVVADWFGQGEKWRNLAKHLIHDFIRPQDLQAWLKEHAGQISAVIHMGANSSTTETDVDRLMAQNFTSTTQLWNACCEAQIPFIYASSAATYGNGASGFDDCFTEAGLATLQPLNPYGWSKHAFDRRVCAIAGKNERTPPQWIGLKFFNVYGPNEYHKGDMQSVVAKAYRQIQQGDPVRLFRSHRPDYSDGGQLRDFIYVRDCVDVVLWCLEHPGVSGLFNVGTGTARSFYDLASAVYRALGQPETIDYIDMPETLKDRYQYYTEANMDRLRAAGYDRAFTTLEDGVTDYVQTYLATDDPYN